MKIDGRQKLAEMRDLCLRSAPLSDLERQKFRQQLADVRAADEKKREGSPQLDLKAAA